MTKELSVEQMSALYDRIYNIADRLIKKHNPCGIQLVDKKVTCKKGEPCCNGCFYLSKKGCTTRSLGCKLTFCPSLDNDKTVRKIMKLLKPLYVLAFLNDFIYIRSSKEEILARTNLTGDREIKYRSVYSASVIDYFPYTVDRKLIKFRTILKEKRSEKTHKTNNRATAKA